MLSDQEHLENIEEVFDKLLIYDYKIKKLLDVNDFRGLYHDESSKELHFLIEKLWISKDFLNSFLEEKFKEMIIEREEEKKEVLAELLRRNNFVANRLARLKREKASLVEIKRYSDEKDENDSKIKNIDLFMMEKDDNEFNNFKKSDWLKFLSISERIYDHSYGQKKASLKRNKIQNLYHFTPIENLASILNEGILSRADLDKTKKEYIFTDHKRIDKRRDFISCSISHPNYTFLFKTSLKRKMIIIEIDPEIILQTPSIFCPTNAARSTPYKKEGFLPHDYNIQGFFLNEIMEGKKEVRLKNKIPENFPTDPQAEILIFKKIPKNYFKRIIFSKDSEIYDLRNELNTESKSTPFCLSNDLFGPRKDEDFWKGEVHFFNVDNN